MSTSHFVTAPFRHLGTTLQKGQKEKSLQEKDRERKGRGPVFFALFKVFSSISS